MFCYNKNIEINLKRNSKDYFCYVLLKLKFLLTVFLLLIISGIQSIAQENSECLECHSIPDLTKEAGGKTVSLFIDNNKFKKSVHKELDCIACHIDATLDHGPELNRVDCSICHSKENEVYSQSTHGIAVLKRFDRFAPTCGSCHGTHYIKPSHDPASKTNKFNIPATCGSCHKEGTEMVETHFIDERDAFNNYTESIHAEGLFKRGLIVSAVCIDCHGSHDILPHQNPWSKINKNNIAKVCMSCHGLIEKVHERIIYGELWEKEPGKIPVCVECHSPHKIRKVFYEIQIADTTCLACHTNKDLKMIENSDTISLYVDKESFKKSVHGNTPCIKCHYDVHPSRSPVCLDMKPVDCGMCHGKINEDFRFSTHGKHFLSGDPEAPDCRFCHGTHNVLSKNDVNSPTFSRNIHNLCANCHKMGKKVALRDTVHKYDIIESYVISIHGKGLLESGLVVSATCTDCHTSHRELPSKDPKSTVNPENLPGTCGNCHLGIYNQFEMSIHSKKVSDTDKELPTCSDCHKSHEIMRVTKVDFRTEIINQCGRCHNDVMKTYFDTYHGKVSKLGEARAAKCYDCHGSHNILPISNPNSTLHRNNIVKTCSKCHPGSNRKFVGYLTHATHHDKHRYPFLYYSFWFMTILLIITLGFFGIHTLLWLVRALIDKLKSRDGERKKKTLALEEGRYILRFKPVHSILHIMVIVSFLALALTGMTIKFPDLTFFKFISKIMGGPKVTGIIHRISAVITFTYFGIHIFQLINSLKRKRITLKGLLTEEYSMIPMKRDLIELKQTYLWFIGKGERPEYGRWTYWEKFDYFAVFWGVAIIGITGLMLWFPEIATLILPGWFINVATVIHSDEALLAAGFIFTIHFFNTHFRPDKFPIDTVIFTGRVPLEEYKKDRPREFKQLLKSGKLGKLIVGPPSNKLIVVSKIFGFIFLFIGLVTIGAIVYAMVFVYR